MSQQHIDNVEILEVEAPLIGETEAQHIQDCLQSIVTTFNDNANLTEEQCLEMELKKQLPEKTEDELVDIKQEIIATLDVQEEKKISLEKSLAMGRSKESWFAKEVNACTAHMTGQEAAKYLQNLDAALEKANTDMLDSIMTKSGDINNNPQLDGFIAEQEHVNTFNLKAESTGSDYRAEVLKPKDGQYSKNSVDIVIKDKDGNIVNRYQSKYCKDSQRTADSFEKGNYRGQQKLIPEEQEIARKHTTVLKAPDGTTSKPLSKERAKELQEEAQSGKWQKKDYNEYEMRDLAMGLGKEAGKAGVMGFALGGVSSAILSSMNNKHIDGEKVVTDALVSGADKSAKVAVAGALKIATEKNLLKIIPKGTPASTFANIANIAVENAKIMYKVGTGELTVKEGFYKSEQVTVSTVAGVMASIKGAALGAAIGTIFGPIGNAVGGLVGGALGYMGGSKIGSTFIKGYQKVREKAVGAVKYAVKSVAKGVRKIASKVVDFFSSLCS